MLSIGLGLLAATGQAPLSWAWLAWLAYVAAIILIAPVTKWRRAAWIGWLFGLGHFAAALFWIVEPFLVDAPRHGWMAPFALLFLSGGLALLWSAAFGLAARMGNGHRAATTLLIVVTLTTAELVRAVLFTGFPWATIGHIWVGWPQMQAAALMGAGGLTLFTLLSAAVPALMGFGRAFLGLAFGAALLALPALYGLLRVPSGPAEITDQVVRVVQPNAEQHLKWHPDHVMTFYARKLEATRAPGAGGERPDIVIWPEISFPYAFNTAENALKAVAEAAQGAQMAIGLQRREPDGRWYNMLLRLDESGQISGHYDKHHLVPFGEYMPFAELFARFGVFGLAANLGGGFSAGPGPELLDFGEAGNALPLICYEAIFPRDLLRAPDRPDWMIHITNDAWFGSLSGPYQHLAQARLRAVEHGLPLMRSANTGISGGVDPYGRLLGTLALDTDGFLDMSLPAPLPPTVYARFGDGPVYAALLGLTILALAFFRFSPVDRRRHAS